MAKQFNRDINLAGGSRLIKDGTVIIDADGNIDAPVTTTDATFSGDTTIGDTSADTNTVNATSVFSAPITVGVNDTGHDVKFFGATAGKYWLWDESADSMIVQGSSAFSGAIDVGVDGSGYDVKLYSATASNYWLWDESDDKVVQTFVSASTSTVEPYTITSTLSGVGVTGGRFKHALTINAAAGSYTNAIKGDVTYGASGSTSGLGSAVLAEMTLSAGTSTGTYAPFEAELNVPTGASLGTATSLMYLSVNGADKATFDTSGYLFSINGLSVASGKVFQVNTAAAATHALRIDIGGIDYFIMLTDTGA